ncbi:N-alpha-acetyltransferase (NAT) (Amino-terminal acetyltransferase) (N-terminal acetyltransferase) [Durusdinium trenchii]|uniref:N-alpha-acetyltransferase (NAT) (Amino-terminal acetyltransferase) (N-terminal acetyltransferase) n=1 Tax=Durusdinium trenchii TaxID=1381693 RepID=A0ABP0HC82_9DINO
MFDFDFAELEEEDSPREKFFPGEVLRACSPVMMREEASLESKVISTLAAGTLVEVLLSCGSRRLLVSGDGKEGWVSAEALDGTILWERAGKVQDGNITPDVDIRRFREADRPWLRIIEKQAFGGTEQCLELWLRDSCTPGSRTVVEVAIGRSSGRVLGYCAWRLEGPLHSPMLHLLGLAVEFSQRRRGLGAALARAALEQGEQMACGAAVLHVRIENQPAQRLYRRLGFLRVAKVLDYYGHGRDAWELLRELPAMVQRPVDAQQVMKLRAEGFPRRAVERALRWAPALELARELAAGRLVVVSEKVSTTEVALRETRDNGVLLGPVQKKSRTARGCNFVQQTSDIAPPLPKVILGMLMEVCHQPLAQKWGYPERVLNLIASIAADALDQLTHLSGLIMRPVSLAYYQHCRVIVIIFSIMWPLVTEVGENQMGAIFDNIVFPFVVYWAMSGLERLAEMMENPVGDDDTDINLLQQLHELEVGAQLAFELAEKRRSALRRTLARVCPSYMESGKAAQRKSPPMVAPAHFEDHFCWLPIPTVIAEGMVLKHGHVDHVHSAFFEGHIAEFRSFLRRALKRHSAGRRSIYEAIPQDAESEELKVYPEAGADTTMGIIQRDCNGFWHYLAFRSVLTSNLGAGELTRQALWRKRMVHLMGQDHPAAELLQTDSQDTARCFAEPKAERSVLLRPIMGPRPRKHHVSEAGRFLTVSRTAHLLAVLAIYFCALLCCVRGLVIYLWFPSLEYRKSSPFPPLIGDRGSVVAPADLPEHFEVRLNLD